MEADEFLAWENPCFACTLILRFLVGFDGGLRSLIVSLPENFTLHRIETRIMTENTAPEITRRTLTYSLALSLLGWFIFSHVVQPLPSFGFPDPQMAYFVDALNPFQGETYGFIDHPGTPISIVSTGILGITYPFIGGTANHFITFHLQHPEIFLTITHAVMIVIAIITLLLISRTSLEIDHWTDGAAAAALAGFFFVLHPESLIQINQLSHNSLNFPLAAFLSLWLLNLLRNRQEIRKKQLIMISTAAGILSAAQLYFAVWVVGIAVAFFLASLTEGKQIGAVLGRVSIIFVSAAAGFLLSTLPIIKQYQEFFQWIASILSHQGHYGGGAPGFAAPEQIVSNLLYLSIQYPLIFLTTAILILWSVLSFLRNPDMRIHDSGHLAAAAGMITQIILLLFLIGKHPNRLYLQSMAAVLPILLAALLSTSSAKQAGKTAAGRLLKLAFSAAVLIFFGFSLSRSIQIHIFTNGQLRQTRQEIDHFLEEYAEENQLEIQSLNKLHTYGVPNECYVLWYGNRHAHYELSSHIHQLCPQDQLFELWSRKIHLPGGTLTPLEDYPWDVLITVETALFEFPWLTALGEVHYTESRLPTFGRAAIIIPTGKETQGD